jgi:hypothetical protein
MVPLVILLDIDGTLIGDITSQITHYEIVQSIKKAKGRVPYNIKSLQAKLKDGIVRPYFKSFFEDLRSYGVEIFIYTASQKQWAEFIIKQIEYAYNIKFNRPIFTRNNCKYINNDHIKSVKFVQPSVFKTLKRKYPAITVDDIKNNIIAIDNRKVYDNDAKLVLCPTYNHLVPENIPAFITPQLFITYSKDIYDIMGKYYSSRQFIPTSNYMKFERQFYQIYLDQLSNCSKSRPLVKYDLLFKLIRDIIITKKMSSFSQKNIAYINAKVETLSSKTFF